MRDWFARQQVIGAFTLSFLFLLAGFLLHVYAAEASVDDEKDGDEAC